LVELRRFARPRALPQSLKARRDAYSIIEGREQAEVGARVVGPGAAAPAHAARAVFATHMLV